MSEDKWFHAWCGASKPVCECTIEDFENRPSFSRFSSGSGWDMNSIRCQLCKEAILRGIPDPKWAKFNPMKYQGVSSVSFCVYGQLVSMKNGRRILVHRTGKPFHAKSVAATRYVQDFCAQVPPQYRGIKLGSAETPLRATVTVVYPSHRQDLDCELVFDCLQIAEVIENDRWIIEKHLYASVDPKNARCEIQIEEI